MPKYEVVVGNIGNVGGHENPVTAYGLFLQYVEISKTGVGRASGEPVSLMQDGDPIKIYTPEDNA